jgi:hypothetical protein
LYRRRARPQRWGDDGNGGGSGGSGSGSGSLDENAIADPLSPLLGFKTSQAQHDALCARHHGDAVAKAFCASATQPPLASIIDVQKLVGLEPAATVAQMQSVNGRPPAGLGDSKEVVLMMPTLSGTAEMAGLSRVMGGYHIQSDNIEGLKLGRALALYSWARYKAYFDGTAAVVE